MERPGLESWLGTLCCVLGQDTLVSQYLHPPRCINKYRPILMWVPGDGLASHPGGSRNNAGRFILKKTPENKCWPDRRKPFNADLTSSNVDQCRTGMGSLVELGSGSGGRCDHSAHASLYTSSYFKNVWRILAKLKHFIWLVTPGSRTSPSRLRGWNGLKTT